MTGRRLTLFLLEGRLAVCRLAPGEEVPAWATGAFASITRTRDELSVVCAEGSVPDGTECEIPSHPSPHAPFLAEGSVPDGAECGGGWRIFRIEGPLDFGLTGILASVAEPLAKAGVSIFALSTFNTDYAMVNDERVEKAIAALAAVGHRVEP